MQIYTVDIELVQNAAGRRMSLYFASTDDQSAIRDAHRWGENRRQAMAGLFDSESSLGAIKLYRFTPQPVAADGYISSSSLLSLYEWKYDWPGAALTHKQHLVKS